MTSPDALASGKGHQDENFPVASRLVRPELRPAILAFYRFARAADDVADHATAGVEEKLGQLARMEEGLRGKAGADAKGEALHSVLRTRGLSDQHALDLLEAFRRDVIKKRYADWAELMDYCRYSAAPVGRFMLDLHGEPRTLWPANDALCAGLQVVNHLQDCAKDYCALDRVYVPLDTIAAHGSSVEALGETRASPALRQVIVDLAQRTRALFDQSSVFASAIADRRLAFEVGVIQTLAESLTARLMRFDPLSERVHHTPLETGVLAVRGGFGVAVSRFARLCGARS